MGSSSPSRRAEIASEAASQATGTFLLEAAISLRHDEEPYWSGTSMTWSSAHLFEAALRDQTENFVPLPTSASGGTLGTEGDRCGPRGRRR